MAAHWTETEVVTSERDSASKIYAVTVSGALLAHKRAREDGSLALNKALKSCRTSGAPLRDSTEVRCAAHICVHTFDTKART
jgi:hypothetical protein